MLRTVELNQNKQLILIFKGLELEKLYGGMETAN